MVLFSSSPRTWGKRLKNSTTVFKICTLLRLAFRNNFAELHLSLLQRSGEINNNVLKL
jgi:hypothetical protein